MSHEQIALDPPGTQEQQLSDVLSEFARTMATDFPIQGILDHLVRRIADILPISSAGVTLISAGQNPRYIAASDDAALRYEQLQTELGEGPCLLAYSSGDAVTVPDLQEEARFPIFTPRALAEGMSAVFTFPLREGARRLGALDLYRDTRGALSAWAMSAAQTLADVAAAYLVNAQTREDLQESSDRSRELSLHDALTGLPNRVLMLERLEHAFQRSRRTGKTSAVFFVDLDGFKAINDTYGHSTGDDLLMAVAQRLSALLRPHDTVARLHGDEFVILCEDLDTPSQAAPIVARLDAAMARPFVLSVAEVEMSASVGVAFADRHDHLPEQVLRDADTAMYQAKRQGGGQQKIFDRRHEHLAEDQSGLERDLRGALLHRALHTEYQPIVTTVDGEVTGFEALVRWSHPTRGSVPPAKFIPLAERRGMINQIGQWVLAQALADRRRWPNSPGGRDLALSVNVSAQQLMVAGFADTITAALKTADTTPSLLTLEVTESVFVRDGERALLVLNDLKDIGVTIALDDFGTGYSSLSYLQRFPVDIVKVDRIFIAEIARNPASRIIVGAVAELAHALGMAVVAEGVETAEQHQLVTELGCDFCQGFYFARPMTGTAAHALVYPQADGTNQRLPIRDMSAERLSVEF